MRVTMPMLVVLFAVITGCGSPTEEPPGGGGGGGGMASGGGGGSGEGDGGRDGGIAARTDQLYTSGSRIKVKYFVGDDGSRQQGGLFDSQLNIACSYQTSGDGLPRCLPLREVVPASQFADSQCSREVFLRVVPSCPQPPPGYIVDWSASTACPQRSRVLRTGPRVTTSAYAKTADGGCASSALSPSFEYFEAGALVMPTAFVGAREATE